MVLGFDRWGTPRLARAYRAWARRRATEAPDRILRVARATMRRKQYCVLATTAEEGVHARVVQPFPPREDFTVLLGTSAASRKVAELEADPRATLVYADDVRKACVTLVGEARVVRGARPRFMPAWISFWPEGTSDPDFVNVLFVPRAIEVWDGLRGVTPEPFGLASARLERAGDGAWRRA